MDIVSYILSKKYTDQTVDGLGAIKGAPCTVQSIVDITDGKRVTLAWESNSGVEQTQSFDIMNGEDGDTIEWNQIQRSGTKIAEVVINGSKTNVYAPNGGGGAGGGHTIIDPAGNDMDQEDGLQFTGNVAVSDDSENGKTVINIPQEVVSLTQAQYNALPSSKLTDGKIYCISDSVGGVDGYPPLIYSDEEREVGVWRDGKPLYQKSINIGAVSANNVKIIDITSLNVDYVADYTATAVLTNGWKVPLPQTHTSSFGYQAFCRLSSSTELAVGVGSSVGISDSYVTLQYTKTTDTAGSGTWNGQGGLAHHYSTNETVVGTWIDGKPLYEKTIDQTIGSDTDYTVFANGISHAHLVNSCFEYSSGRWMSFDYISLGATSNNRTCYVDVQNGALNLHNQSNSSIHWIATIQYTKTTD